MVIGQLCSSYWRKGLISKRKTRRWTALHKAAFNGHMEIMELLMEGGADTKAESSFRSTVLHLAAQKSHDAVVRLLVEEEVDVDAKDKDGWTALHWAAFCGNEEVA